MFAGESPATVSERLGAVDLDDHVEDILGHLVGGDLPGGVEGNA